MVVMGNSPDKSMASASGQALLAHELTHVAQQAKGAGGGLHRKALTDMPFTHEHELEAEEHEIAAYQEAIGSPLTADQRMHDATDAHAHLLAVDDEHRELGMIETSLQGADDLRERRVL